MPTISRAGDNAAETADPPLAIDPEWVRMIVQNEADDRAGIDAMQPMIASDSQIHWALPLPPGLDENAPELFGFYTYELRVGHYDMWSTAQGRFGAPLRVAGIQHPPPPPPCTVLRNTQGIMVSAPFALPVLDDKPVQPLPPLSQIWGAALCSGRADRWRRQAECAARSQVRSLVAQNVRAGSGVECLWRGFIGGPERQDSVGLMATAISAHARSDSSRRHDRSMETRPPSAL
jgi:hypothetical protein